jgi:predicted Holliday junction resolvase-like endonuclease
MLKDAIDFLAAKGLLSPSILAVALVAVVYFQTGVDAEQRKSLDELHDQQKVISQSLNEAATNNRITAAILSRIDEHGTKHEMETREKELDRREGDAVRQGGK